ncbi:MAG: hypothetical protein ACI9E1_001685 [Cryomorphaceae bacterium]|jgi:hypothetical protein
MRTLCAIFTTLLICIYSSQAADKPFSIAIVPSSHRSEGGPQISWSDGSKESFYVVLTNKTDKEQRVFETWNSWGYYALSFEITLPSGEKARAKKKPVFFTINFPSTFIVPPKGYFVFEITLDKDWIGKPDFWKDGQTQVKIKAIYELSVRKRLKERGVWIVRIESKELAVKINHWKKR